MYINKNDKEKIANSLDTHTLLEIINIVLYRDTQETPVDKLKRYLNSDNGKTKDENFNNFKSNLNNSDIEQTTRVEIAATIADILETKRDIYTKQIFIRLRKMCKEDSKSYSMFMIPASFGYSKILGDKLTEKSVNDIYNYLSAQEIPSYNEFVKLIEVV